jgi:hypothetical protein
VTSRPGGSGSACPVFPKRNLITFDRRASGRCR